MTNIIQKVRFSEGKIWEYVRYSLTGGLNFLVSQCVYMLIVSTLNINYLFAYSAVTILSVTISYFLNTHITFHEDNYSLKKFSYFPIIYFIQFLMNIGILIFVVEYLYINELFAPLFGPPISGLVTFFLIRVVIKENRN